MWWLYILRCVDSSLYTGITTDIKRRIAEHESGKGAKYCRGRAPLELVFSQSFKSRSEASSAEVRVKRLSREDKFKLITGKSGVGI